MSLFGNKEIESYAGVDIGNSSLKVVELQNVNHQPQLLTYGYIEQVNDVIRSNTPEAKAAIVNALKQVWTDSHIQTRNVVAALPSYTVFASIIHLPKMKKKELAQAIQWEAKKFVPMPLAEMVLDWKILDETEFHSSYASNQGEDGVQTQGGQGMMQAQQMLEQPNATIESKAQSFYKILLTAAPRDLVGRYVEIFKMANLKLVGIETESFALERSLIGNDPRPALIIDLGAVATNFSVVVDGVPIINRSIDIAGNTITKAIANSLNVDIEQAEQFKRDFGLTPQTGQPGSQTVGVPHHIDSLMAAVINEIMYVLNLYQSQTNGPIEKIVLTGGSAWLPHIVDYIHQKLGAKVFIGDPWAQVGCPPEIRDVLVQVGPRMSVSIGLAMRQIVQSHTTKTSKKSANAPAQ